MGARFTKWRGVYSINEKYPSQVSLHSNAHALARYSARCSRNRMVPIVEPEVLMDGNHTAESLFLKKTSEVIKKCFEELILHKIDLTGNIIKTKYDISWKSIKNKISNEEVADLKL